MLPTARALGLSFVFLPLALLRGTLLVNVALLAVAIGGYAATLLWRRVVSLDELRSARNIIRT